MSIRYLIALTAAATVSVIGATADAQARPAIRQLGTVEAKSREAFGPLISVRALTNGKLLVNDGGKRRVLLFDNTLATFTVVADSTSATANAYSGRMAGLIAYRGDSTLFVDPASMSMLVIDGSGKIGRVMSVPRAEDALALASPMGGAGLDASGRMLYRAAPRFRMAGPPPAGNSPFAMPSPPDSAAILRVDLQSRRVDTVGFIRTPKIKVDVSRDANGGIRAMSQLNPLPVVDDWAILSDGSVAVVRGHDYHVDFYASDGSKRTTPKIPFEWQRLTDENKIAFIDSVKAARDRMGANTSGTGGNAAGPLPGTSGAAPPGAGMQMIEFGTVVVGQRAGDGQPGPARGAPPNIGQVNFVAPSELPDYKPAFFAGSTRADAEGNLWIRTIPTASIPGGPVYDVINGQGQLVERVQIPSGRTIAGFAAGGRVYLTSRDGNGTFVERARVR